MKVKTTPAFAKATAWQPRKLSGLERVTRLELATSSLARRCSTTELHPHREKVEIMAQQDHCATANHLDGRVLSCPKRFGRHGGRASIDSRGDSCALRTSP